MKQALAAFGLIFFGLLMGVGLMRYAATEKALQDHVAGTAPRPERTADGRIALYYTAADRAHISGEMLFFLQGVQTISAAVAEEDRETIRDTADSLRIGQGRGQGQALQAKSPEGFRTIGRSLRQDFGAISDMAMTADMSEIQMTLGDAMTKCVACHGSYKAVEISE